MVKEFGDKYPTEKEDCVGHIQKRMGKNLRNYKKKFKRGQVLDDGQGVGGKGRLTDAVIDSLQNYYGAAIRNNQGSLKTMTDAVWAIFYHTILGGKKESLDEQHKYCPRSSTSWCRYQKDKINGTSEYNQDRYLPNIFRAELKPIFDRLSCSTLLERCLKGFTQNQNESINNILWAKCPKRVFCGKAKLEAAAAQTIIAWNVGAAGQGAILERVGITDIGTNTLIGYQQENKKRIYHASRKVTSYYRRRRQRLRFLRKKGKSSAKSYQSGGFTVNKLPDKDIIVDKLNTASCSSSKGASCSSPKTVTSDEWREPEILFVSDSDVREYIR